MRVAGIRRYSAPVEFFELRAPDQLKPDEVLVEGELRGRGELGTISPGRAAGTSAGGRLWRLAWKPPALPSGSAARWAGSRPGSG